MKQIKGYGNLLKIQKFFQQNPKQNFWRLAAMRLALKKIGISIFPSSNHRGCWLLTSECLAILFNYEYAANWPITCTSWFGPFSTILGWPLTHLNGTQEIIHVADGRLKSILLDTNFLILTKDFFILWCLLDNKFAFFWWGLGTDPLSWLIMAQYSHIYTIHHMIYVHVSIML